MSALETLQSGDVASALPELFSEVRSRPEDPRPRVFLFQLLAVNGEWDRALTQLNVAGELDPDAGVMAKAYQEILHCEALRREVFAGARSPLVFGEPEPWMAQLIEAVRLDSLGDAEAAQELRAAAFDAAPAIPGTLSVVDRPASSGGDREVVNDAEFEWIADGDSRLGPTLEMIVNGRYYWAPWNRISSIELDPPTDLRDLVWAPARFQWANGGEAVGVIPTRYPATETSGDDALKLARKTCWEQLGESGYVGLGQRVLVTDIADYGLLELRRITLRRQPGADKPAVAPPVG